MTLSDLASIGSLVSGVAVVITLVFLVVQMRQANRNQRALMQQMRSARSAELQLKAAEPYVAEAMNRAFANDMTMNDTQIRSFLTICVASVTNWEDSFFQHRAGAMDAASFASDIAVSRSSHRFRRSARSGRPCAI
jgi:heme exporter protein D